jgi:hypothetical protein
MVPSLAFFITSAVITCSWSAGVDRPGVSKDILISSITELLAAVRGPGTDVQIRH